MKYVTLLILLLLTGSSFAQSNKRDSLWNLLSIVKEDSSKINLLTELGQFYANNSTSDSALLMFYKGLELATTGYKKGELKLQGVLTYYLWSLGDFSNSIGMGYHMLESAKARKDTARLVGAYALLFNSYRDLGDFEEALKLVNESLTLSKKFSGNNCESCGTFTAMIGSVYFEMGKYDSALHYLQKSLMYPNEYSYGWILLTTGRTWEKMDNRKLALEYYRQSIDQLAAANNMKDLAGAYTSLANLFNKMDQSDSALHFGNLALNLAKQSGFKRELMDAYLSLSAVYESIDNSEALAYYKLAHNLKNDLYNQEKQIQIANYRFNEELRRKEIEVSEANFKNRIRMNVMLGSTFTLLVVVGFLVRNSRLKQKAKRQIETAFNQLKSTQSQLIQSEKMASLGELTAGIAHEIQNPLNFVNNFSEVNTELIDELKKELAGGNSQSAEDLANDIKANSEKINHHGKRAGNIVKGMLQHSRSSSGVKEPTDINALADEYLRLAYHGLRAKDKSFTATMRTEFDETIGNINIIPQDIGRVILNLITNAFYAVNENRTTTNESYEPTVTVSTKKESNKILISVKDNGNGIPDSIKEKIFQPFFTTKPTGQGTGLGLSLSYDIVKAHGGELKVESVPGKGTEFIFTLWIS